MDNSEVYVVMTYWDYEGGDCLGAFLDKDRALSVARNVDEGDRVEVQTWLGDKPVGTAYFRLVD